MLIYLLLSIHLLHGQNKPAPEYRVKAAFLYNFTRFIKWPETAFGSANAPFIIGIVGSDPFGDYITEIAGEKVGSHPIIIRRYRNFKDIVNCHLLFISSPATSRSKEILSLLDRKSILTVSDKEGFTSHGGMLNFYKENNKIRFEINLEASKNAQLEISSKLLSVAKVREEN